MRKADTPNIDSEMATPCRNAEVSGRRTPGGRVVDLWFGQSGASRYVKEAVQEAVFLCETLCPDAAYRECAAYFHKAQPEYGIWAGMSNEFDIRAMLDEDLEAV